MWKAKGGLLIPSRKTDSIIETWNCNFRRGGVITSSQLNGNVFRRNCHLSLELQWVCMKLVNMAHILAACYGHHFTSGNCPLLFYLVKTHNQTHTLSSHSLKYFAATDNLFMACSVWIQEKQFCYLVLFICLIYWCQGAYSEIFVLGSIAKEGQ